MTNKKKKGFLASLLAGALALVGCSSNEASIDEVRTAPKELPIATIVFKDYGTIEAELYPHIAPNTVNNFISLANSGFYDGLTFHRIIKDFMIQGGDPDGTGMGGPGYGIKGEFSKNKFKNDLAHTEGVLSMARSQSKDSAGSQFFIVTKDSSHLDGQYASFGKVINGIDIVHKIENIETGSNDKPTKDVIIESIKVDTKGIDYKDPDKI
ncbi:MAG: peptidylprolyl isomerase [Romboutsia sp.]|uniref:peptidylprolyl isomerase n=1 Tax=Romboutsia sp. TaxID=1965302 RepID=UPI003F2F894E